MAHELGNLKITEVQSNFLTNLLLHHVTGKAPSEDFGKDFDLDALLADDILQAIEDLKEETWPEDTTIKETD